MPALRAFKRRWNLGSDDLVYPGMMEILLRLGWVIILLVIYLRKMDELSCEKASKISLFYIGTIAFMVVNIIFGAVMVALSARGTIKDTSPRRHVSTILYVRLVFLIPELGWAILGAVIIFREVDLEGCVKLLLKAGKGVVIVQIIILLTMLVFTFFMFDPLGRRHIRTRSLRDYHDAWHQRCNMLCCCLAGDQNRHGAFEEIADLLSKFFKYKDVVLTDVIAGLVLLHARQKYILLSLDRASQTSCAETKPKPPPDHNASIPTLAEPSNHHAPIPEEDESADPCMTNTDHNVYLNIETNSNTCDFSSASNHNVNSACISKSSSKYSLDSCVSRPPNIELKEWMTLENATYYSSYAVGSYASYNYVMCRNCSHRGALCSKYRCCCVSPWLPPERVEGDNSCGTQTAAILQYTGINPDDIIFANFENQIYETPFFIAIDHTRQSVVIAIRGTKTFQDALTDLTAYGEAFEAEGVPPGNVHGGMLKVADNIMKQLDEINFHDKVPQGYNLVLTGHSLGGGAAVIVSMMLRHKYPDLICFAYSPPGGLVSLGLQLFTQDFVCSVVLGNDLVPRLSVISMEKFKHDLLKVIKYSRTPKYKILASGVFAMCCGWKDAVIEDLVSDHMVSSDSESQLDGGPGASVMTNRLFDMGESSTRSNTSAVNTVNNNTSDNADTTLNVTADSTDGLGKLLRPKEDDIEPTIRPTTYQQFYKSHQKWQKDQEDRRTGLMATDPLYLAGHVLHVIEEPPARALGTATYYTKWCRAEEFDKIVVSPNMLHHHHGYVLRDVLQRMVHMGKFLLQAGGLSAAVVRASPRMRVDNVRAAPSADRVLFSSTEGVNVEDGTAGLVTSSENAETVKEAGASNSRPTSSSSA